MAMSRWVAAVAAAVAVVRDRQPSGGWRQRLWRSWIAWSDGGSSTFFSKSPITPHPCPRGRAEALRQAFLAAASVYPFQGWLLMRLINRCRVKRQTSNKCHGPAPSRSACVAHLEFPVLLSNFLDRSSLCVWQLFKHPLLATGTRRSSIRFLHSPRAHGAGKHAPS